MAGSPYFRITSCCDPTQEGTFVILEALASTNGTFTFTGTDVTIGGVNFINGNCYSIENVGAQFNPPYPSAPPISEFVEVSAILNDCENELCPDCGRTPTCYRLVNCEGIFFNTLENLSAYVGQFIEIEEEAGTWFVIENDGNCNNPASPITVVGIAPEPCPCICYEINGIVKTLLYVDCDNQIVKDFTITKFCSRVYPFVTGTPGDFAIASNGLCSDGACGEVCYKLTNCDTDEVIYSTLQSLSQYVNTSSVLTLAGYTGCWSVEESINPGCDCITVTIQEETGTTEYIANSIGIWNGKNVYSYQIGASLYYIWFDGLEWQITRNGYPGIGEFIWPVIATSKADVNCPELITDGSETGWVLEDGVEYIGLETERCVGPCDCAVDVTIIQEYDSCTACEPTIAYKLQNCEKIYEVQYTLQDLSAYVGQVIEDDCGCWTVEEINYVPPSVTLITVDNSFKTCNACLSKYYRLTDCLGEAADIVTATDLSTYLGQTIKIENCDTCWEVSETRVFTELAVVTLVESYDNCEDCGIDIPCVCSRLTNITSSEQTVSYTDCNNEIQQLTLAVGETSEKICLKKWDLTTEQPLPANEFLYPEYFGDCQHGVCPQPVFKNNRTVKPGYNTPICSAEKYDKITCKFAQAMYKDALEKRYGISNCCPDEDMKWIIEKELIDLQALKDPNYKCSACSCSCTKSSCNCKN